MKAAQHILPVIVEDHSVGVVASLKSVFVDISHHEIMNEDHDDI